MTEDAMLSPDTVTEAVAVLRELGYLADFTLVEGGLCCEGQSDAHALDAAVVDHTFRFEGDSDPGDSAIVLGLTCPSWSCKGVLVSAYGADVEAPVARALRRLATHPGHGSPP